MEAKACVLCGGLYTRKRWPSGKLEGMSGFRKRMYCSASCQRKAVAPAGGKARWAHVDPIEDRSWPWRTQMQGKRLTDALYGIIERQITLLLDRGAADRIRSGEDPEEVCQDILKSVGEKLLEGALRRTCSAAFEEKVA